MAALPLFGGHLYVLRDGYEAAWRDGEKSCRWELTARIQAARIYGVALINVTGRRFEH